MLKITSEDFKMLGFRCDNEYIVDILYKQMNKQPQLTCQSQ